MRKQLITLILGAGLALSATACGQAPDGSNPQQASVSTSVTPELSTTPPPPQSTTPPPPSTQDGNAISRERAVQIAIERTGGGNVDEVENEFEHGRTAWKVRVIKNGIRYSVYIDKGTGDIIRFRDEGQD